MIKASLANVLLNSIKYAGIYLCGIILAAYLIGDFKLEGFSSIQGTNGLAPVQISGYLGFSCTVFLLSILNDSEPKSLFLNILLLAVSTIVMLLSFSRGGLYFLAAIMALYFFFNLQNVRSYMMFMVLIPVVIFVYFFLSVKTNGLLEERYTAEGSSGRDKLVENGWKLFLSSPLAGVGTGNFNSEIKEQNLYRVESGAHNEFIRIAAEDGVLGLITYWTFFIFLGYEIMRRKNIEREYALYFSCLLLYDYHS